MFLTKKSGPLTHKAKAPVKNRPLAGKYYVIQVGKMTKRLLSNLSPNNLIRLTSSK